MARSYRHIQQYEKEMPELKAQGLTVREIGDKFGLYNINQQYMAQQTG